MNIWTLLSISFVVLGTSFKLGAQDFMKTPPKPVSFGVLVKDSKEPIQGAFVEVLIQDAVVIQNVTNGSGNARLSIAEYRKQPVVIRVTVAGYKQKEMRNLFPKQDGTYTLVINQGDGVEVEEAKPEEVVVATPVTTTPKSKKQLKKEKKAAKSQLKKEEAYRAELAEITKELSLTQSTRGRLQSSLDELEEKVKSGSVSESEAQKKRDSIKKDIKVAEEQEQKIKDKIKALDQKYGKV
jgi:FtsZ-binding cell division protein ZapB